MSYEVIARRWRPQDFSNLVGQDHVRTTLLNALKGDRLHHALLFTGPRGTGKTSTARILAKSLRCPNAVDFAPCNKCPECEDIAAGRAVDVMEIDGASNNGVDAIRELRETVGYMPASGRFKMYIIDEVHMLSTSAFNALLKTLEEPPEHVFFIMATTEAHKIPNTILSRCQRFDFRRIPSRAIAQHLQSICEREGHKHEPEALWILARQSDGSMRDAQSLLDQVINFSDGDLRRETVVTALGLTDRELLNGLLKAVIAGEVRAVADGLTGLHEAGSDPKLVLLDLMEQIRNALVLKISANSALVDLPDSEREALVKLSAANTPEDLHLLFDMALKGAQDLTRAADPLLVLEMVLMRMATAPKIDFTISRASPTPSAAAEAPVAVAAPVSTATAAVTPANRFRDLVDKIKDVNGLIGAQLENAFVSNFEGKTLTLGVPAKHKFLHDKMNQPEFRKKVANYMNSFWGPGHTLNVILAEPPAGQAATPKAAKEKDAADRQQAVRDAVEAHPLVRSARGVFKTEIKSITEIPAGNGQQNQGESR